MVALRLTWFLSGPRGHLDQRNLDARALRGGHPSTIFGMLGIGGLTLNSAV